MPGGAWFVVFTHEIVTRGMQEPTSLRAARSDSTATARSSEQQIMLGGNQSPSVSSSSSPSRSSSPSQSSFPSQTWSPSILPSWSPSELPSTPEPTGVPSLSPSGDPSELPSISPTVAPTLIETSILSLHYRQQFEGVGMEWMNTLQLALFERIFANYTYEYADPRADRITTACSVTSQSLLSGSPAHRGLLERLMDTAKNACKNGFRRMAGERNVQGAGGSASILSVDYLITWSSNLTNVRGDNETLSYGDRFTLWMNLNYSKALVRSDLEGLNIPVQKVGDALFLGQEPTASPTYPPTYLTTQSPVFVSPSFQPSEKATFATSATDMRVIVVGTVLGSALVSLCSLYLFRLLKKRRASKASSGRGAGNVHDRDFEKGDLQRVSSFQLCHDGSLKAGSTSSQRMQCGPQQFLPSVASGKTTADISTQPSRKDEGKNQVEDAFDSYKNQNLEKMRTEVEDTVCDMDVMMSQALTSALDDSDTNQDVKKLMWGGDGDSTEIEVSVLCETHDWLKREKKGGSLEQRHAFMQKLLKQMVDSVRFNIITPEKASRAIHGAAAMLQMELSVKIPETELVVIGMQKHAKKNDMIEAFKEFGEIVDAAVAPNERGFGLVRYRYQQSVKDAMERFLNDEIVVQDVSVSVRLLSKSAEEFDPEGFQVSNERELAMYVTEPCQRKVATEYAEKLPLHDYLRLGAQAEEVQKLLNKDPILATLSNKQGRLPLHVAAMQGAQKRILDLILQHNTNAATTLDAAGDLPVHHLARKLTEQTAYRSNAVEAVELLLSRVVESEDACKATGSAGVMLPLHIATKYNVKFQLFEQLLTTYAAAASQLHVLGVYNQSPLGILGSNKPPGVSPLDWKHDFNLKLDLLFAHNPSIAECLPDSERLYRLKARFGDEARSKEHISLASRKVWVWLCTRGNSEDVVKDILEGLQPDEVKKMAYVKMPNGEPVLTGSTHSCRRTIRSFLLFAGRYEIAVLEKPLHKSDTSVVLKARDYGCETSSSADMGIDLGGEPYKSVVFKFMRNGSHLLREKNMREGVELVDNRFPAVVPCIDEYDLRSEDDSRLRPPVTKIRWKGGKDCEWEELDKEFRYALVLPMADRTLDFIYRHERPSVNEVRSIMEQIGKALQLMHRREIIHGDLKPLNIVRLEGRMTLIDLDASCRTERNFDYNEMSDYAGEKFSSGVIPPEMIDLLDAVDVERFEKHWAPVKKNEPLFWDKIKPKLNTSGSRGYVVKTCRAGFGDLQCLPYTPVCPSAKFDTWSFGVLLFTLLSGEPLFKVSRDDDLLSTQDLHTLHTWDTNVAEERLSGNVFDALAKELIQKLLSPAETRLDTMAKVLGHRFFHPIGTSSQIVPELQQRREPLRKVVLERDWRAVIRIFDGRLFDHDEVVTANEDKEVLLHLACKGDPPLEVVREILMVCPGCLTQTNQNGELPLHTACFNGAHPSVVKELVSREVKSMSAERYSDRMNPLHLVQRYRWKSDVRQHQQEVLNFLRRKSFPSFFDAKTDLPTKEAFMQWAWVPPPGCDVAGAVLCFIDISGFKSVNDSCGYEEGDHAIKTYAESITDICGRVESPDSTELDVEVFRMGGDEFAVLGKFAYDERHGFQWQTVWSCTFRQLVYELSCLTVEDNKKPPRYCTFARIGCCSGDLSNVNELLKTAEDLERDVKDRTSLCRGESQSLSAIQAHGISNVKISQELLLEGAHLGL